MLAPSNYINKVCYFTSCFLLGKPDDSVAVPTVFQALPLKKVWSKSAPWWFSALFFFFFFWWLHAICACNLYLSLVILASYSPHWFSTMARAKSGGSRVHWARLAECWGTCSKDAPRRLWSTIPPLLPALLLFENNIARDIRKYSHFTLGFPGGSVVKNSPTNGGDVGLIPGSRRSPGKGNGNPLQYSENSMDQGTWQATVHGVSKSQTWLSMQCLFAHTPNCSNPSPNSSVQPVHSFLFFSRRDPIESSACSKSSLDLSLLHSCHLGLLTPCFLNPTLY